jgi:hypothetical protein
MRPDTALPMSSHTLKRVKSASPVADRAQRDSPSATVAAVVILEDEVRSPFEPGELASELEVATKNRDEPATTVGFGCDRSSRTPLDRPKRRSVPAGGGTGGDCWVQLRPEFAHPLETTHRRTDEFSVARRYISRCDRRGCGQAKMAGPH